MRVVIIGHHVENVVRAFETRGHEATAVLPAFSLMDKVDVPPVPDLVIAFPPCRYLCSSGLHWNTRIPERRDQTEIALQFVQQVLDLRAYRICLENPVGCISSRIRKPDQIIHPWMFGHDASKKTCLWLKNLPKLVMYTSQIIDPRMVNGKPRWGNQFDSGQNNQINATDRGVARAERWQGVADAMAEQWGAL